ncbi:MAG: ATPase, T2SS/T4P/T4SS family [Hungatella sp.]
MENEGVNRGMQDQLRDQIREELNEKKEVSDEALYEMIDRGILEMGQSSYLPLREKIQLREGLFNSFRRLDVLQKAMDNPAITEVMINGSTHIFVEENGRVKRWNYAFETEEQLEDMIQQIVSRVNRLVNVSTPIADARMSDGSRVHVVLPPIALDGPTVTIRKFPRVITMETLLELGAVSEDAADLLKHLVRAGYNIFISGGTNSGKTTFLNALSAYIPKEERVITIEDSAELQIQQVQNLVRLETRNANAEGEGAIGIGELIRASLRMNPDRIIVGEVRGKEALELLNAYNTGHDGGLSSGHGNNPKDMLARLETMVLMGADLPLAAIRSQIASALDIMIHLGRLRDKSRRVLQIVEVGDYSHGDIELHPLYQFAETGEAQRNCQEIGFGGKVEGELQKVGELKNQEKLRASGILL